MTLVRTLMVAVCMVVVLGGPTWAEPPAKAPTPADTVKAKPWEAGVSETMKANARKLFDQANQLFDGKDYAKAIPVYRAALKHWEHPSIGFNLAECLIELGRYLDANGVLDRVLRFGRGPLSAPNFATAQRYRGLVKKSLARVTITCDEPGAVLTMNGTPLLTGPKSVKMVIEPGSLVIVAKKLGFKLTTQTVIAGAGVETVANVKLAPLTAMREVYPVHEAIPWSVFGAGVAVLAGGAGLFVASSGTRETAENTLSDQCPVPAGCKLAELPQVTDLRQQAEQQRVGAIAMLGVGSAALIVGIVMLILNQPDTVEVPVTVTPVGGPTSAGLRLTF